MAMPKKDFIALADKVRGLQPLNGQGTILAQRAEDWTRLVYALADFCAEQNPAFNRARWIGYIKGECGPNGGAVKPVKAKQWLG
jgi:hypothetical protein